MIVTSFLVWKYCYGLLRIISGTPDDECPGDLNGGWLGLRGIDQGGLREEREKRSSSTCGCLTDYYPLPDGGLLRGLVLRSPRSVEEGL